MWTSAACFWGGRLGLLLAAVVVLSRAVPESRGENPENPPLPPIGQFLTLSSPIDDAQLGRVSRVALALEARARQEQREGILVLEIPPGNSSAFHQVQGLAKFLTSDLKTLRTVAWIPQTVRGNHTVIALACREIVIHPDAELGDIGRGKPLADFERDFVKSLAEQRHNLRISLPLLMGMMDRSQEVIVAQIQVGNVTETRVMLRPEFEKLLEAKALVKSHQILKAAGSDGVFLGRAARDANVLVQNLATSRDEVAKQYRLPLESLREAATTDVVPEAMVIRVQDMIDPMLERFVMRQIQRAVAQGVNLLIFDIDSPGGYLLVSQTLSLEIAALKEKNVRTVAYVPKMALSGAAIIALGCDEIYLHPTAQFGDSGPIEMREGGQFFHANEKALSLLESHLTTLAQMKQRPAGLLKAMANRQLVVFEVQNKETGAVSYMTSDEIKAAPGAWTKKGQVPETGKNAFLTVNGNRAHELRLAEAPVQNFEELKQRLGLPAEMEVPISQATWVDTLIYVLNSSVVTGFLFALAMFCIFLEIHFPSGFFGICAAVAFGIFFWSRWELTAGWLELILFLIGVGCILLEVFVIPGFGVFGIAGGVLVFGSLVLASQTFVVPTTIPELERMAKSLTTVGGAVVGVAVLGALTSRFLPRVKMFDAMILTPPGSVGTVDAPRLPPEALGGLTAGSTLLERSHALVGRQGIAQTLLRPAGKVAFGEELVDVVSDGEFIKAGQTVKVVSVNGARVVVREVMGQA